MRKIGRCYRCPLVWGQTEKAPVAVVMCEFCSFPAAYNWTLRDKEGMIHSHRTCENIRCVEHLVKMSHQPPFPWEMVSITRR